MKVLFQGLFCVNYLKVDDFETIFRMYIKIVVRLFESCLSCKYGTKTILTFTLATESVSPAISPPSSCNAAAILHLCPLGR